VSDTLERFRFTAGTYRVVEPEETLRRISPHLPAIGITRCLDITGLDTLGVPTFCATRPRSFLLQTSAGKGQTRAAAQAAALMESIELHHAEDPRALRRASFRDLEAEGWQVVDPARLEGWRGTYYTPDYRFDWVTGEALPARTPVQVPAGAVYFIQLALHATNSNGLAGGNSLDEATLHALYELVERDAVARVVENGRLAIRKHGRVVDPATVTDPALGAMLSRIEAANTKVVLIEIPSRARAHTFWAALLNRSPLRPASTLNVGFGTHGCLEVAASRALTEAAQCRGSFIHGSREDLASRPVHLAADVTRSPAYLYFDALPRTVPWQELAEGAGSLAGQTVQAALSELVDSIRAAGHREIYRCDLTRPEFGIAVVKLLVPGLGFHRRVM
jgi:YcaO-like protein with predicted kinase domain